MQGFISRASAVVAAVLALGCGGGGDGNTVTQPPVSVLSTVTLTPAAATLFTVSPGSSTQLAVIARDQNDAVLTSGTRSYSSGTPSVASVSTDGTVSAVGIGSSIVTVSVAVGGVTKTASAAITVRDAASTGTVTAPEFAFLPGETNVSAGGSVTWSIGAIHHSIVFDTPGAPSDVGALVQSSATRQFTTNGIFAYHCDLHSGMSGTVVVH